MQHIPMQCKDQMECSWVQVYLLYMLLSLASHSTLNSVSELFHLSVGGLSQNLSVNCLKTVSVTFIVVELF